MERSRHAQDIYNSKTLKKNFDENVERIIEYLQNYYRELYENDPLFANAYFFISIKKSDKWKDYAFTLRELYTDPNKIEELISENIQDADIYHSVFIFKDKKRKKENIIYKTDTFVIDVEREDHSEMTEEEKIKISNIFENLETHDSGRGIHVVFKFEEVVNFVNEEYMKATYETLAELVDAKIEDFQNVHADMNATLLTQVVRIPYSINQKIKRETYIIQKAKKKLSLELLEQLAEFIQEKIKRNKGMEDEEEVAFLDDEKLNEIAEYLADKLKDVYKKGRRHFLALSISAFLKKFTNLNEEQTKYIIKKIAEILGDTEIEDRLRAVEDTYKKDVSEISYYSILYDKITDAEITYVKNVFRDTINTFAISKFKFKIYALLEKTVYKYKFVFMDNKKIQIIEMKKNEEDEFVTVAKKEVTNLSFKIKRIKLVVDDKTVERYFDVVFYSTDERYEFKDKTLIDIVKTLKEAGKLFISKTDAENVFARLFEKYKEKYKIKTEIIYKTLRVSRDENTYVIENDPTHLENIIKNDINLDDINTKVVEKVLNNVKRDEHLIVLLNAMFQNYFRETDKTLSIITIFEGEKGLGKTTLARLFTTIAFVGEEGTQDTLASEFRTIELLSKQYNAILLDDASDIKTELVKILKAVVTGSYRIKRGRSNLKVDEYEVKSSIVITSNEFNIFDDAFKDRLVILKVDDYTFKNTEIAEDLEFLELDGWGYVYLQKIIEYLNNQGLTLKDIIKKQKADIIELDLSERRKRMYAQIFAFTEIFSNIVENEELRERFKKILENKEKIINTLEAKQITTAEEFERDAIIQLIETDKELKDTLIEREEDGKYVYYITSATIQKLKTTYKLNISFRKLSNTLDEKITTINYGGRTVKVIKFKEEDHNMDELYEL